MSEVKQVIVMRKDLNMRKGKMCAQAAHASIAFLTNRIRTPVRGSDKYDFMGEDGQYRLFAGQTYLTEAEAKWIDGRFTKICVYINSEEELARIAAEAKLAGLTVHVIKDAGLTEFGGVPTYTCLAIGPNWSEDIDKITGNLPLL